MRHNNALFYCKQKAEAKKAIKSKCKQKSEPK